MRYKLLGRSGLRVSELCLGTMTFGEDWGWGADKAESRRIYDAFLDAGGNFIDTANVYTNGTSETLLGEFMKSHRDRIVMATKYTNHFHQGGPIDANAGGNHRKSMMTAVEHSLKRLQTDYIDLYWLHIWDQMTPVDEVLRGFDDLVRQGKILYAGVSDAPAWWVSQANTIALLRNMTAFVSLQIEYSLIERTVERELLPMARAFGLTIAAWSPLAGGILTGKYTNADGTRKPDIGESARYESPMMQGFSSLDDRKHRIAKTVMDIARECERSAAQVAVAWLLHRENVIPIIGGRKLSQIQDNITALDVVFSRDQLARLDDVSRVELGFPYDFYNAPLPRAIVYGGARDMIDA